MINFENNKISFAGTTPELISEVDIIIEEIFSQLDICEQMVAMKSIITTIVDIMNKGSKEEGK